MGSEGESSKQSYKMQKGSVQEVETWRILDKLPSLQCKALLSERKTSILDRSKD
jgi:hypothetical protein